jgi:hypothetical protein
MYMLYFYLAILISFICILNKKTFRCKNAEHFMPNCGIFSLHLFREGKKRVSRNYVNKDEMAIHIAHNGRTSNAHRVLVENS